MKSKIWVMAVAGFAIGAYAQENYSQWSYYKNITVNTTASGANVVNTVTRFPVLVRLTSVNADVFSEAASGGTDIRFTKADGVTRLPHQRERWDAVDQVAEFWVLLDTVAGNGNTGLRMYWGKSGAADSSSGAQVFTASNGYVGVWHLGDSSGTAPRPDAVSGGFPATPTNFPVGYTPKAGDIGLADSLIGGPALTGNAPYLQVDSGTATTLYNFPNAAFTYSIWAYPTATPANARFLEMNSNPTAGNDRIWLGWNGSTNILTFRYNVGTGTRATTTPTSSVSLNQWHHIVVAIGANAGQTTDTTKVYLDGALASGGLTNSSSILLPNVARDFLFLGRDFEAVGDTTFAGKLDEPELSNVTRSADWVALSYQTQKSGATCVSLGSTLSVTPLPSNLSYSSNPAVYTANVGIANNNPTVTGTVTGYAVSPALPAGLSINATTGVISGTPTAATTLAGYVVTASNSAGSTTDTVKITVTASLVAPSNLTYSANPAVFTVSTAIPTDSPKVTGTVTGYTVTTALPAGLSINAITGAITGTPTAVSAAANYIVIASNSAGSTTATLNITVNAALAPPTNLSYSLNPATYTVGVPITNNVPTVTGTVTGYAVSPALPAGLSINATTGVISGTPSAVTATAKYAVTASNGAGSVTDSVSITDAPVDISSSVRVQTFSVQMLGSSVLFNLPGTSEARLVVMDIWGRVVWSQTAGVGTTRLSWNGRATDHSMASGMYLVRLTTNTGHGPEILAQAKVLMVP